MSYALGDLQSVNQNVQNTTQTVNSLQRAWNTITNVFDPGKTRDEQRQARADFFQQAAIAGSVTAMRYILGGLQNTASHEIPMYQAAASAVQSARPDVYQEATLQGAKWAAGIPDPGGTQSMINDVKTDLLALAVAPPATPPTNPNGSSPSSPGSGGSSTGTTHPPVNLPGMHTTAPYNYTPVLLVGGVVAAALLLRKR